MLELLAIDVSSDDQKTHGRLKFMHLPRIGEWVEVEENQQAIMYEVVMVAHSTQGANPDIFVKRLAGIAQAHASLRSPSGAA